MAGVEGVSLLPPAMEGSPEGARVVGPGLLLWVLRGGSSPTLSTHTLGALVVVSGS